jgi:hypothetical protein
LNRPLLLKSEPSWILAGGFVPSVERGKKKLEGISFNPLKGKMKLRELGFKQSELVPNFKIRILFRRSPTMVSLAEKIKNQWIANLGFDSSSIELLPRDDSGFRDELMLGRVSVFLEDQWVSNTILPDDWISKFVYDRSGGFTHYFSSEMREIYRTGDKKHIQSLESILIERDAVLLPLYYDSKRILISKRVRGLELSPLDLISVGKINFGI